MLDILLNNSTLLLFEKCKKDRWRPKRKLLTPTFHYDIRKNFVPVFNEQANILVQKMGAANGKLCHRRTMGVASLFSIDTSASCFISVGMYVTEFEGLRTTFSSTMSCHADSKTVCNANDHSLSTSSIKMSYLESAWHPDLGNA
ncbi:hypothetical protein WR25_02086 [Diploscapter pachys]|uniref:Uncharacterized protein n=1 Tax=Diploscapter pachys TaxID=2018661 RepID=A0A2A2K6K6_9BILA|nr:hypothetical protein WR25_02086 [Diploscapter pachys]